jgi:para-nitrobenzyl esterase
MPLLLIAALAAAASPPLASVRISSGELQGRQSGTIFSFLGVPYASDTAGANRWRAPQWVTPWSGVRDAAAFGADCPQGAPYEPPGGTPWTSGYFTHGPQSEDCLFLNVWTPTLRASAKLPVLVWIHGGAFAGGSGAVPIHNGAALAARGIVVITINYRLGVLGFMALPALTAEAGSSGNYGLMDQIAALQWVKRNIAKFGGDPARVTIAGQSAGAASVQDLIASPAAQGLFAGAIVESDPMVGPGMPTLASAEAQGQRIAAAAKLSTLAELRALPLGDLTTAANHPSVGPPGIRFVPIRESRVLPDPQRQTSRVPVLIGLNADEASAGGADWNTRSVDGLQQLLARRFGDHATRMAALYPARTDQEARSAARAMLTDRGLAALLAWSAARVAGSPPAYAYLFDGVRPGSQGDRFGSFHTLEVPFVFDTLAEAGLHPGVQERQLAAMVRAYWINFVRTGDPNGLGLPAWPVLRTGRLLLLRPHPIARTVLPATKRSAYADYLAAGGTLGLF